MARDRDIVDKYSGGGRSNISRSTNKTKKKEEKKPVGAGAKPKSKPAKTKRIGEGAKPRKKPDAAVSKVAAKVKSPAKKSGASRSTEGKSKKAQNRSGDAVLGMSRKDSAAKKMDRQPGYSSKSTKAKKSDYMDGKKRPTNRRGNPGGRKK